MKLAVLSDIHGNLPALQAVAEHVIDWGPDRVFVNGDVVGRGPMPRACWQFILQQGWEVLSGNHEEYALNWRVRRPQVESLQEQFYQDSLWTFSRMTGHIDALAELPERISLHIPSGQEVRLTHGSMLGTSDGIYPETDDSSLLKQIAPAPAVFLTAHTHRPLVRSIERTLVVNSGSVGAPFDGDERACYAQLVCRPAGWQAEIVRLPYDRAQTLRDFHNSGYLTDAGPITRINLYEWRLARPLVRSFFTQYEGRVLAGAIDLGGAVAGFLEQLA